MKRSRLIDEAEAAEIGAIYQRTGSVTATIKACGRSETAVSSALERYGFYKRKKCPRLGEHYVRALYAIYQAGASLNFIGRETGRGRHSIREAFERRGLELREPPPMGKQDAATGRIIALPRLTDDQLEQLARAPRKRIMVPPEIRLEWREWTLEKRHWFIARMRAALQLPGQRPERPFSANVEPFEYGSPRAHAIADRENAGLNSRFWKVHMKVSSQGVIWRDQLYFWSPDGGGGRTGAYYSSGGWTAERGRPSLHHIIWEYLHGPVPPHYVIRMRDDNPNNFDPENLYLATRNDVARENQATALTRKSRALTQLLLDRNQTPKEESHGLIHELRARHTAQAA